MLFGKPSLVTRIAIGKSLGLLIGLCGFIAVPYIYPDASWQLRWGILLWYTTVGAFIGVFGVFSWHPILRLPLPWWVRAPIIGAWMNFVLTFFAFQEMRSMLLHMSDGALSSPFWFVFEGALIGAVIGFVATRFGGEGLDVVDELSEAHHGGAI